jgi:hypothetical protein
MKRGDKSGQFYLLAAIVIIALIIGIFTVANYSKKKEDTRVYELAQELEIESSKMLEYSLETGTSPWDSFTKNFSEYAGKDVNILYIIGNITMPLEVYSYNKTGQRNDLVGPYLNGTDNYYYVNDYLGSNYKFKIREGKNFYFIITQEINGDKYVATNE